MAEQQSCTTGAGLTGRSLTWGHHGTTHLAYWALSNHIENQGEEIGGEVRKKRAVYPAIDRSQIRVLLKQGILQYIIS